MSGPVQLHVLEGLLVSLKHSFQAITLWIEDVSIQSEAVASCSTVVDSQIEFAAKTKGWELLIRVVKLEDVAYRLESLVVLVLGESMGVVASRVVWLSVGKGEVDGDGQVDLAASEDVVEERVSLVDSQVSELHLSALDLVESEAGSSHGMLDIVQSEDHVSEVPVESRLL